jgi:hypothetical protein
MKSRHVFYTKTMGDLYLEQGYVQDAENVYMTILTKDPGRTDCLSALSLCREKDVGQSRAGTEQGADLKPADLAGLVRSWVDLIRQEGQGCG